MNHLASKQPSALSTLRRRRNGSAREYRQPADTCAQFRCSETVAPYGHDRDGRAGAASRSYPRETALRRCDVLALSLRVALHRVVPALARAAAAFVAAGAWRAFGYARAEDHARERFGRSARWMRELAALGSAFERLPGLEEAVADGGAAGSIGRAAASIIARVAAPESLHAWLGVARKVAVRELRELATRARREGSAWPPSVGADGDARPSFVTGDGDGVCADRDSGDDAGPEVSDAVAENNDDDVAADGVLVRLLVPAPVKAAFDEALDLYRALAGSQTTVSEFLEALVADAQAGPHPCDAHCAPLGSGAGTDGELIRALREKALARSTDNWKQLSGNGGAKPGWALALAGMSLATFEAVCARAGTGGPEQLDEQISVLIRLEDDLERKLARLLADMADQNAWARLRFDGVGHYAEQRLGMSRSAAEDRVRALRGLSRLPIVRAAYERGDIGLDATLLVVRVLQRRECFDEASQRAWVLHARGATSKRLRDEERLMVRLHAIGAERVGAEAVCDDNQQDAERDGPDLATIRGRPSGTLCAPPDDGAWQRSLRREAGTARRRIAFFGSLALQNLNDEMFLRLRLPSEMASAFLSCIESARERLARLVEEVPWDQPWPEGGSETSASVLSARMYSDRCRRSPAWVGLLALLEDFAFTWDDPEMAPVRAADAVYIRDGWRCTAPGCTSRRNLESHHVVYRSRGGGEELWNLTTLCRFHHQVGEHGGLATCRGVAPLGLDWTLGRNGVGGGWRNEIRRN